LLTFYLMGIPISLIAEFFLISRRALRRLIEKYRDGDVRLLLNRPSKGVKKTEDKDLKDRLFAVMHADLPLSFHPAAARVSEFCTPSGAGGATDDRRSWSGLRSRSSVAVR
jgi:hypothetical protein